MGIKLRVKNSKSEIKNIERKFAKAIGDNLEKQTSRMTEHLARVTPVLTGVAQAGWTYRYINANTFEIKNPVAYIGKLNRGSSKQAPAFFIEITALKYGRPRGLIVKESSET